ncbi:hypothetical protein DERF_013155 [Dermatophagoides farinae]|uniref:Uncharacterized protein n=1 Tax=Dermatophagoides farinae TaxID=6954 RepID=A0A922HLF7_DERFA|nr:hypothetical protein DERF_013155 [Dermatophagoides farinae]
MDQNVVYECYPKQITNLERSTNDNIRDQFVSSQYQNLYACNGYHLGYYLFLPNGIWDTIELFPFLFFSVGMRIVEKKLSEFPEHII